MSDKTEQPNKQQVTLETIVSTLHHIYEIESFDDEIFEQLEEKLDAYETCWFLIQSDDKAFEIWEWDLMAKHLPDNSGDDGLSLACTCNTRKKAIRILRAVAY